MSPTPPVNPAQPSLRRQLWRAKRADKLRLRLAIAFGLLVLAGVFTAAALGWLSPRAKPVPAVADLLVQGASPVVDRDVPLEPGTSPRWSHETDEVTDALRAAVPDEAVGVEYRHERLGTAIQFETAGFRVAEAPSAVRELLTRRMSRVSAGRGPVWSEAHGMLIGQLDGWECLLIPEADTGATTVFVRHAWSGR
jgi:hypothetical protein